MGSSSSIMRPQELVEFRKLNTSLENVEIPARDESRTVTDKKGFVVFGLAIILLLPFLIYSLVKADIRHITSGTDDCGNFCGYENELIANAECSGKNYVTKPYSEKGECVEFCSESKHIWGRCIVKKKDRFTRSYYDRRPNYFDDDRDTFFDKFDTDVDDNFETLQTEAWRFFVAILITIALGILTMIILRFIPGIFVWSILIFSILVLILITAGSWILYFQASNAGSEYNIDGTNRAQGLLGAAVVWTIFALIILTILICLFKKVGLVIQLYKETVKALAAMPMLVFVPVLVAFIQIIIFVTCIVTTIYMATARELLRTDDNRYLYVMTGVIIFSIILNLIVTNFAMRFISGIQFMTISGSVSRWYFAKNKQYLDSPICSSFRVTMKYHLGTVAFGSFIMMLFSVVKAIIKSLCRNACCRCLTALCCNQVDIILKFLSENSYIETGIHGQSYLRSAKRATKLLLANATSVIAINCVGDFILGMIVFIVTVVATGLSFAVFMSAGPAVAAIGTVICFFVNLIIISIMFGTFQTIIDTVFICFCEDSILNDGMSRPYFMSRGLMEFVENSKKLYGQNGR